MKNNRNEAAKVKCAVCGKDISYRGNGARYCEECAHRKRLESSLARYYRVKAEAVSGKQQKQRHCIDCGADISDRGEKAVRCEKCAKLRRRELARCARRASKAIKPPVKTIDTKCTERCKRCIYFGDYTQTCDYLILTGHGRNYTGDGVSHTAPPSECKKFEPRPSDSREWNALQRQMVDSIRRPGNISDNSLFYDGYMMER